MGDNRGKYPCLLLLFLGSSFLDMLGIGLIGPFIKFASDPSILREIESFSFLYEFEIFKNDNNLIVAFGLLVTFIFNFKSLLSYFTQKEIMSFSFGNKAYLINRLVDTYQKLDYSFHIKRNSASLIQRLMENTNYFTEMTLISSLRVLSEAVVIGGILIVLLFTSLEITASMVIAMITIMFFYDKVFKRGLENAGDNIISSSENIIKWFNQTIYGYKEIQILKSEKFFYNKIEENGKVFAESAAYAHATQNIPKFLTESALVTIIIGLIIYTVATDESLNVLIPVLGTFAISSFRLIPSLNKVSISAANLRISTKAMDDLYEDLNLINDLAFNSSYVKKSSEVMSDAFKNFKQISIKDVYFEYKENLPVLSDLSLDIYKGECIGIVGMSGAGKTTLIDLLLGFHKAQKGVVSVDEKNVNDSFNSWRSMIAYIPQSIFLIDDTIEKNITFETDSSLVNLGKLKSAIRTASLEDVIDSLPEGTKTVVGEHGAKLSGGQRQRIALARAFYHDRQFIIMDEGTSALDHHTEAQIVETINGLKGDKTLIVVTHRKKILDSCDKIYKLEDGTLSSLDRNSKISIED